MSGGFFDYQEYKIREIADTLESYINRIGKPVTEESEYWSNPDYPQDIVDEFKTGLRYLRLAELYTHRIDWLVSCDDGEDSFRNRLAEDLKRLND